MEFFEDTYHDEHRFRLCWQGRALRWPLCFDSTVSTGRWHQIVYDFSHDMTRLALLYRIQLEQLHGMRFRTWWKLMQFSFCALILNSKYCTYLKAPCICDWLWPECEPDWADAWPPPLKIDPAWLLFSPSGLKPICACDDVWPGPLPWASAKPPFSFATTDDWLKCFEPPPCDEADVPPVFSSTSTWACDFPVPPLPWAELNAPSLVPDTWTMDEKDSVKWGYGWIFFDNLLELEQIDLCQLFVRMLRTIQFRCMFLGLGFEPFHHLWFPVQRPLLRHF